LIDIGILPLQSKAARQYQLRTGLGPVRRAREKND